MSIDVTRILNDTIELSQKRNDEYVLSDLLLRATLYLDNEGKEMLKQYGVELAPLDSVI